MSEMNERRKAKTSKPLVTPKLKHDLLKHATELAKAVNSKDALDANRLFTTEKEIDIPKLEQAIARCRRNIALQSRILDELEAEVKEIKRDARKKKPAKSKKQK